MWVTLSPAIYTAAPWYGSETRFMLKTTSKCSIAYATFGSFGTKIAVESSKQCGRSVVPKVGEKVLSIDQFCAQCGDCGLKLVFWENEKDTRVRDLTEVKSAGGIAFLIGPEGGLSLEEVETARFYGFRCVTLGPRKLRAETASLAVLSIIQNLWGDF